MVFQEHALFPHLTAFENVAFGLQQRDKSQRGAIAREYLMLVGLEDKAERYPHALSGGERQRIALARALAPQPVLLLMDEPFNSLDADLRAQVREQVHRILKSIRATAIFVTHDQEEALQMGDRLAVFRGGMIEQIGEPESVYHASQTRFVAEFMGESDFLTGETTAQGIQTPIGLISQPVSLLPGTRIEIALRADDINFVPGGAGNGVIQGRFFRGPFYLYRLKLDSGHVVHALKPHSERLETGTRVKVFWCAGHDLTVFWNGVAVGNFQ
jgi:iron(III) transport system ATP-binding protein